MDLPEYKRAGTVLWYVSHGDELPTRDAIRRELDRGREVLVPYVDGPGLRLWRLRALEELRPGAFGILEPPPALRGAAAREAAPERIDLVVVPGVAFDPLGRRIGSGQGFYDRLLARLRADCVRAGLCYEAQVVDRVPAEPHDQPMDLVVTERRVIRTGG
jgi:5-formyltetrahydrofolate cyclo-ligase